MNQARLFCSFRDPSGFVFYDNGRLLRQVNLGYKQNYDFLINSGLYEKLSSEGLLVPHIEIKSKLSDNGYKVIEPFQIPFISYSYEWSFSQLKQAALTTIKIQRTALKYGMSLKDSSSYNIQFIGTKPVFIDTLSFEIYPQNKPWIAYRQFCQHFLAPLALMSYKNINLSQMLKSYLEGISLSMAASLLSANSWFNLGLLIHLHLHAKSQGDYSNLDTSKININKKSFTINALYGLLDSLESVVSKLNINVSSSQWSDYYFEKKSYTKLALEHKQKIIEGFFYKSGLNRVLDLGANTGFFSRIAAKTNRYTISSDYDPMCVEVNYRLLIKDNCENILPLVLDVTNPTPAIGWQGKERFSLFERSSSDLVMALALVHHLAISNNLPFDKIADFFTQIAQELIIEFVPKDDAMVQSLLRLREDIFQDYTQENFEKSFRKNFDILEMVFIADSKRILYLMRRRNEK